MKWVSCSAHTEVSSGQRENGDLSQYFTGVASHISALHNEELKEKIEEETRGLRSNPTPHQFEQQVLSCNQLIGCQTDIKT